MSSNFKKSNLSLVAIDGHIALSKTDAWAFYKLSSVPYEFLEDDEKETIAYQINNALEALIQRPDRAVDCHLLITSRPLDTAAWRKQLELRAQNWDPMPGFPGYIDEMEDYLAKRGFQEKEVFLGVHLGKRSAVEEGKGFAAVKDTLLDIINTAIGIEDKEVSEAELTKWRKEARIYTRSLETGKLGASPATASQIARLVKQPLYPSMEVPPVTLQDRERWGRGEILALTESFIENNRKFLKITQTGPTGQDIEGYRATLAFSRFPDVLEFPAQEPWIHYSSMLGWGVNFYSRFSIVPSLKVKKDVHKKLQEAKDEAKNATAAGGELPLDIQEKMATAQNLEYSLNRDRDSWIYGWHRITVEAPTEALLRDRVTTVIDHYRNLGIEVVWSDGDQFSLLQESMPADRVRVNSYQQRQSLSIISGGMPTATEAVGDRVERNKGWIGPFLGVTTARIEEPVFLSVHSAIARNNAPGVIITGSPGGGKSFTAFTLTCQMALQGVWAIYIDPKADASTIVEVPGMGYTNVFDLRHGEPGMLDPFSLSTGSDSETNLMAVETLRLLAGSNISPDQESVLYETVAQVAEEPNPSLTRVVDVLMSRNDSPAAKSLAHNLDFARKLPFANLCFAPQGKVGLKVDQGLTVITMLGLDLPNSDEDRNDYTLPNRLAVAIMYLLTTFTLNLMESLNRSHPKAVIVDEAWAITSTREGKKMIPKIARMGRSLNTALIMVSQNAGDFLDEGLVNSMSIKLAFRAKSRGEVSGVLDLFDLTHDDYNREIIQTLNTGECLMQDADGRTSLVQVESWNPEWQKAFDTNPETRGKDTQPEPALA